MCSAVGCTTCVSSMAFASRALLLSSSLVHLGRTGGTSKLLAGMDPTSPGDAFKPSPCAILRGPDPDKECRLRRLLSAWGALAGAAPAKKSTSSELPSPRAILEALLQTGNHHHPNCCHRGRSFGWRCSKKGIPIIRTVVAMHSLGYNCSKKETLIIRTSVTVRHVLGQNVTRQRSEDPLCWSATLGTVCIFPASSIHIWTLGIVR